MEKVLPVYILAFGLLLTLILLALRGNENASRNLAKIRVRVDDSGRRRTPEPPEEEMESSSALEKLLMLTFMLFLLTLVSGLR